MTNTNTAARIEDLKATINTLAHVAAKTPNKFTANEFADLGLKTVGCDAKTLLKMYWDLLAVFAPNTVITK